MTLTAGTPRRRFVVSLAILAALLGAGVGVAAQPAHAARMEVAIQDDSVFLYHYFYDVDRAYSQARAIGATRIRFNVIWSEYQRFCGRGSCWGTYDRAVDEARAHGLRVQMTVAGTPEYDRSGDRYISFRRPSPGRYRGFLVRVAKHFKGRVFRYSIWNEPNLPRWIYPSGQAPKIYSRLLAAGYPALKKVDRRIEVLAGELTSAHNPMSFLSHLSKGLKADGLAYHPFEFFAAPGPRSVGFVGINSTRTIQRNLRNLARQRRLSTPHHGALPLYYTEFAYLSKGHYAISEKKRAKYAPAAFKQVKRQGVREMLWYMLVHPPNELLYGDTWDSGIVQRLSGKPDRSYDALRRARRSYAGF